MSEIAIEAKGLAKAYKNTIALQPVNLSLSADRFYGLIGRNGSGKSTLMKLFGGIEKPSLGEVYITEGKSIGYVSNEDDYPYFLSLKVLAELFKSSKLHWEHRRYEDVLNIFNLEMSSKYGSLSTGQKAGVKLAVMLAQKPDIWLLDEATLGIDILAQGQSLTALLKYFIDDKPCVVFCTHDMNEIERLADEVIFVEDGKIAWQGEKDQLVHSKKSLTDSVFEMFDQKPMVKAKNGEAA